MPCSLVVGDQGRHVTSTAPIASYSLILANIVISRTIRDSDKSRNCGCQHIDFHSTKDIMPQWMTSQVAHSRHP